MSVGLGAEVAPVSGESGPFASAGFGVPVDPPEVSEDPPVVSVGVGGEVAPVSGESGPFASVCFGVPVDPPEVSEDPPVASVGLGEAASGPLASGVDASVVSVGLGAEVAPEWGPFASVGFGVPVDPPEVSEDPPVVSVGVGAEVAPVSGEAVSGPCASGVDASVVSVGLGAEVAPVSGELGPFASVGFGVPVDPPEVSEDPPVVSEEPSVGLAGGVAPVSVCVSLDVPASGEAVEDESEPDLSVGVPVADAASSQEGVAEGFTSDGLPVFSSQARNINHR